MGNTPAKIETIAKAVQESVQQSLNSTVVNIASSTNAALATSQVIDISGLVCQGDFNFSNITQRSVIRYDLSKINTSASYNQVKSSISAGVSNALNSSASVRKGALSLAGDMGVSNENEAVGKLVNRITNSYTYDNFSNDVMSLNSNQVISVKNIIAKTGDCNLNNLDQRIVLKALASQISQTISQNTIEALTKSSISQTTTTKTDYTQTGILQDFFTGLSNVFGSISGFFWIIIFVVIAAIFGFGYLIYSILGSDSPNDNPAVNQATVASS